MPQKNKKLKLCFLSYSSFPNIGGVENHLKYLCAALKKTGLFSAITIITAKPTNEKDIAKSPAQIYRLPLSQKLKSGLMRKLLRHLSFFKALPLLIKSDIIHFHDTFIYWNYFYYFRHFFPKKKIFITFHGFEGFSPPRKKDIKIRQKIARQVHKSIEVGEYINKWYKTNPSFVTYGAVDELAKEEPAALKNKIVFIGRLAKDSSLCGYIDSLAILAKEYQQKLPLDLYGFGSQIDKIKNYAAEKNIVLNYRGAITSSSQEIYRQYKLAFCSGYLSLLEAAICKCHIFCYFDNPLKKDYFTLGFPLAPYITASDQPELIAQALAKTLQKKNDEKLCEMYKIVKKMSWSSLAKNHLEIWGKAF